MRVSELAAVEDTLPRPKQRWVGNAASTQAQMPGEAPRYCVGCRKAERPYGTLRLFVSVTGPLSGPGQRRCLLLRWYYDPIAADRHDTEVIATVLLPAGFVVLGANRALLAITHEVEAICCNAVVNEVPLGACRTALAEGQVVLVGATLVSVTLDTYPHARVSLQPRDLAIECSSRV